MQSVFTNIEKKVIFFDFNDTLLDKDRSFANAYAEALSEFTARWDADAWSPRDAAERYWKEWLRLQCAAHASRKKQTRSRAKPLTFNQKQLRCIQKSLELTGCPFPLTEAFLSRLHRRAKELTPACPQLFPKVKETLEQLAGSYRLALISNGSRAKLETILTHSGLKPLFPESHIFVPETRCQRKPKQDIFMRAMKTMGVSAGEAVMVGNSWKNDIFGANRCGMDAVWLQRGNKKTGTRRIGRNKVISVTRCHQLLQVFKT